MWWSSAAGRRRRARLAALCLLPPLLLAGCAGFTPLYPAGTASGLPQFEIAMIPDRNGQVLRGLLLDRLSSGSAANGLYRLETALSVSTSGLGTRGDGTTLWMQVTVTASFVLKDGGGAARAFSISRTSGYNQTREDYASLEAERNAVMRSLREIADDARLRITMLLRAAATARPAAQSGAEQT